VGDEISSKVVTWAHGKLGQQVGRGECWDLIDRALRAAGARSSTTTGRDDDYVWGRLIRLEEVSPGDILQFRNFVITTKSDRVIKFPDGRIRREMVETVARRHDDRCPTSRKPRARLWSRLRHPPGPRSLLTLM